MPANTGYGGGVYRRHITLAGEPEAVEAELEDDFHRFGLRLVHDGTRVVRLDARAARYPWTTCPEATRALRIVEGTALSPRCTDLARHTDPKAQCTHLFDLAGLAVAHAARRGRWLRYRVSVPDRERQHTVARLEASDPDVPDLTFELEAARITGPAPFVGQSVVGGHFLRFCRERLDPAWLEPAFVLWRACAISWGRAFDVGGAPGADRFASMAAGNCFSFQPGVVERAKRQADTVLDFTDRPEALLPGKP